MSLRIHGDDLDPSELTAQLGVEPTKAHRRGELTRRGQREIEARTGSWVFSLGYQHTDEWDLDGALNALLDQLPGEGTVWQDIARRYRADVFCGLFMGTDNQGTDLQPATLQRLGVRRLALGLDIFGPGPGSAA